MSGRRGDDQLWDILGHPLLRPKPFQVAWGQWDITEFLRWCDVLGYARDIVQLVSVLRCPFDVHFGCGVDLRGGGDVER